MVDFDPTFVKFKKKHSGVEDYHKLCMKRVNKRLYLFV